MKTVEDICNFHGVATLRMQSRVFTVAGEGGTERPFFVGEWVDQFGVKRRKGMADVLAQPKVTVKVEFDYRGETKLMPLSFVHPLWIECKFGTGTQSKDQKDFQIWVESIGASYLVVTDNGEQLMEWFKKRGVTR